MSDEVRSIKSEASFNSLLESLSDEARQQYEQHCRIIENRFLSNSANNRQDMLLEACSSLPKDEKIRTLVITHLGRCWLEQNKDTTATGIANFIHQFPELINSSFAIAELNSWLTALKQESAKHHLSAESSTVDFQINSSFENPKAEYVKESSKKFDFPEHLVPLSEFGPSGMGRVFIVKNTRINGRIEVIKIASDNILSNQESLMRFKTEPLKASQFNHPSIVTVFDCDESDEIPYFRMEYMNAGSLADKLNSGPISASLAVQYSAVAARALDVVNKKGGFSHGDIKPENMLFTRIDDGIEVMKLADFGLARQLDTTLANNLLEETSEQQGSVPLKIVGTRGYIAPEQISPSLWDANCSEVTSLEKGIKGDVFALGATLYKCLTGKLPYQKTDVKTDLIGPIINEYIPPSSITLQIDQTLDAICRRALDKNPRKRFKDAREMAVSLEHWLGNVKPKSDTDINEKSDSLPPLHFLDKSAQPHTVWLKSPWVLTFLAVAILPLFFLLNKFSGAGTGGVVVPESKDPWVREFRGSTVLQEYGESVVDLNRSWLELWKNDPQKLNVQLRMLRDLPTTLPLTELKQRPYLASLYCTITPTKRTALATAINPSVLGEDNYHYLLNYFTRFTGGTNPDRAVDVLGAKRISENISTQRLIASLHKKNLPGAEVLLMLENDSPGAEATLQWLADILNAGDARDPDSFLPYLGLFIVQGHDLCLKFQENSLFRKNFNSKLWPLFKKMALSNSSAPTKDDFIKLEYLMTNPGVWKLLEKDEGEKLLNDFGLVPIALLYGNLAFPPELHSTIINLIQSRNKVIIESLLNAPYAGNAEFHKLLQRPCESKYIARAIFQLNQLKENYQAKLEEFNSWDQEQFEHELNPDKSPDIFDKVPYGIYLKTSAKLISGKRLYSDEKHRLLMEGLHDAITMGLPYTNVSKEFIVGFSRGFKVAESSSIQAQIQKALEDDAKAQQSLTAQDSTKLQDIAKTSLQSSQDYVNALKLVQKIVFADPKSDDFRCINQICLLFNKLTPINSGPVLNLDLKQVQVWQLPDHRAMISFTNDSAFAKQNPELAKFFDERAGHVKGFINKTAGMRADSKLAKEAERAWQESISAWWLLSAMGMTPTTTSNVSTH